MCFTSSLNRMCTRIGQSTQRFITVMSEQSMNVVGIDSRRTCALFIAIVFFFHVFIFNIHFLTSTVPTGSLPSL